MRPGCMTPLMLSKMTKGFFEPRRRWSFSSTVCRQGWVRASCSFLAVECEHESNSLPQ